jgi:hypothetical protein
VGGWLACIHTIKEPTGNGNLQLTDEIMILLITNTAADADYGDA